MTVTVRPSSAKTETVAYLSITNKTLTVTFAEKREDFKAAIKGLDYHWEGVYRQWQRTPHKRAGTLADRLAETGRVLLAAGFVVAFPDETIAKAAVEGAYAPEVTRWILTHKGEFRVYWGRGEDWYNKAMRMTGAHYDHDIIAVLVRPEHYEEVLDFAQIHGFGVSEKAQALADEAAQKKAAAWVVDIDTLATPGDSATRPTLQPQEEGIDDSLLDEPL
jgi:hypothetical protein